MDGRTFSGPVQFQAMRTIENVFACGIVRQGSHAVAIKGSSLGCFAPVESGVLADRVILRAKGGSQNDPIKKNFYRPRKNRHRLAAPRRQNACFGSL